jgi:hypothetical protein
MAPQVIIAAFRNPMRTPTPIPANSGRIRAFPSPGASPATITPVKPTTEPTDRSMPAVIITYVMPIAMNPMIDDCRTTFVRLSTSRKFGAAALRYRKTPTKITRIP